MRYIFRYSIPHEKGYREIRNPFFLEFVRWVYAIVRREGLVVPLRVAVERWPKP